MAWTKELSTHGRIIYGNLTEDEWVQARQAASELGINTELSEEEPTFIVLVDATGDQVEAFEGRA